MGAVSRKALKIVRKSHPLPCQTTVQKNVGFLYVVPGYIVQNIEYVKYLQSQPGWSAADAMISVSFDDIKLDTLALLDPKLQCLRGPHEYAFLLNIRPIVSSWKPICYYTAFDFDPSKDWYEELISNLYDIELMVCHSVCDQGPKNRGMCNAENLNITTTAPFIKHPRDASFKVYWTFDPVHLYKSAVNHIRDDQCKLPSGTIFSVADFQELLDIRGSAEISIGSHLTQQQLSARGQDRQDYGPALKLLSHATADTNDFFYPNSRRKAELSEYIRTMSDMQSVLSSNRYEEHPKKLHSPFGILS